MSSTSSDAILEHLAGIGQAMASPHRLRMITLLSQGPKSVEDLARQSELGVTSASMHLKTLRGAGLVLSSREGRRIYYRLAGEEVARFWVAFRELGEAHLPAVREILHRDYGDSRTVLNVQPKELQALAEARSFVLLDVRPTEEYHAGHIPGARSLPFADFAVGQASLPKRRRIAAYCRGPYCQTAVRAVQQLRAGGLNAYRLPLGVNEWRAAGLKLDVASTFSVASASA